jgi:predicted nucleotidyltransferase
MMSNEQMIQKIVGVVNKTAPNSEVFLYDSRASGDANRMSDWYVLVLIKKRKISFDDETYFMNAFYELELEIGEVLTPLIYAKHLWEEKYLYSHLFENIQREGIRIL